MKGKTNSKRRGNSRGRRATGEGPQYERNARGGTRSGQNEERPKYSESMNDISWYSKNPNLLLAAGSFPYPYRPGMSIPGLGNFSNGGTGSFKREFKIPGVMALNWAPNIGYSQRATDPASLVGKEIYAKVRAAFSGTLRADAPDYVMYLMALDSIFSYIAWLKRVYRVLSVWTPENYAVPDTLLSSFGLADVDIVSLRTNKTKFWQLINELILQSRKFTCPASMDIMNRHYWMSDNVYTDAPSMNSQMYVFNLTQVYKFQMLSVDTEGNTAPGLVYAMLPHYANPNVKTNPATPEMFYNFGRDLIDALVAWDDAYTINGYLRKAYEGTPSFIVEELEQYPAFNPVYVEEVLTQIENSRTLAGCSGFTFIPTDGTMNVTQSVLDNAVINPMHLTVGVETAGGSRTCDGYNIPPTLSIHADTPTVADSVIASRLQVAMDNVTTSGTGANKKWTFDLVCGTELPISWVLWMEPMSTVTNSFRRVEGFWVDQFRVQTSGATFNLSFLSLSQFDWHPFVFLGQILEPSTGTFTGSFAVVGDTHNITSISVDDLRNLHKICVLSELNAFEY